MQPVTSARILLLRLSQESPETPQASIQDAQEYTLALEALKQELSPEASDSELLRNSCLKVLSNPQGEYTHAVEAIIQATYQKPFRAAPDLLHQAIRNREMRLVEFLLQNGAAQALNQPDAQGFPPLYYALDDEVFLDALIDELIVLKIPLDLLVDNQGNYLLHHHMKPHPQRAENVRTLLKYGASWDRCNKRGEFPWNEISRTHSDATFLSYVISCVAAEYHMESYLPAWKNLVAGSLPFRTGHSREEGLPSFCEFTIAFLQSNRLEAKPELTFFLLQHALNEGPYEPLFQDLLYGSLKRLPEEMQRQLLFICVQDNHLLMAEQLIALISSESLDREYPPPRKGMRMDKGLSPFNQTLEKGSLRLLNLLREKATNQEAFDEQAHQAILNKHDLPYTYSAIVASLATRKGSADFNARCLVKVINSYTRKKDEEWVAVLQMLKNINPTLVAPKEAEAAYRHTLNDKQYQVLDHLLDFELPPIKDDRLHQLLQSDNPIWLRQHIERLLQKKMVEPQAVLQAALNAQNREIALKAIQHGAEISEISASDRVRMQTFLEELTRLTPAEQILLPQLTPKVLALVLGDAFLGKMRDHKGTKLAGHYRSAMLQFTEGVLRLYSERTQAISPDVIAQIEAATARACAIEQAFGPGGLKQQSGQLLADIQQLQPGESLLIPSGFDHRSGFRGHATLTYCRKEVDGTCTFLAINSGDDGGYHDTLLSNRKEYMNSVRAFRLRFA